MTLDLVTPQGKIAEQERISSVVIPAAEGEIEVLEGHADLLTLLRPGLLKIHSDRGTKEYVVTYGFAEIRKDRAIVLAETCEDPKGIDKAKAKADREDLERKLTQSLDAGQLEILEHELAIAQARERYS